MKKILVIDDEKPTLSMFKLFLGAFGYQVFIAEDGERGLEVFSQEKPAIVFTDIKMPGMDGLTLLGRLKAIESAAEVIVMTGHGDMDLTVQALDLEATDFINKPVQRSALDAALKRAEERLKLSVETGSRILFQQQEDVPVITVEGKIDGAACSRLAEELGKCRKDSGGLILHLDQTFSVGSEGIAGLVELLSARESGILISGVSENYEHIFKLVGIARFVKLFETLDEALGSVKPCL